MNDINTNTNANINTNTNTTDIKRKEKEDAKYSYNYAEWREAGALSYKAINYAKTLIKPGAKILDVANAVEAYVLENGQRPAFPINLSINEAAAHYTPGASDTAVFTEKDLIKVDFGSKKGTGAGDCALTIDLSDKYAKLVEASEKALQEAISIVKAGRRVDEIGKAIEAVAKSYGFSPIRNLGGHGITETDLHAYMFIPNYDNGDATELEEGQVVAIEPFMTTGEGYVVEGTTIEILAKTADTNPRSQAARRAQTFINDNYGTYPFAIRWLTKELGEFEARRAIAELSALGVIEAYPVLIERSKGMVAQSEASLIVTTDSCEIITK
ncbi:MAG: type II methionyl aminopeptidase [Candidatus Micrarchaeaceae archaeon]